jgi:hypothetical protein
MSRVLAKIDAAAVRLGTILTSTGRARLYREVARRSSTCLADQASGFTSVGHDDCAVQFPERLSVIHINNFYPIDTVIPGEKNWRDSSHLASPASRGNRGAIQPEYTPSYILQQDSDDAGHPRATRGLAVPEKRYQRAISVVGNRA